MIEKKDIDAAIAECLGKRNPDASTCIKLAAFYTIKHELFEKFEQLPTAEQSSDVRGYSYAPAPDQKTDLIVIDSDSDFARVIDGREQKDVWPVLDELMATIQHMIPKLYNSVMQKLY